MRLCGVVWLYLCRARRSGLGRVILPFQEEGESKKNGSRQKGTLTRPISQLICVSTLELVKVDSHFHIRGALQQQQGLCTTLWESPASSISGSTSTLPLSGARDCDDKMRPLRHPVYMQCRLSHCRRSWYLYTLVLH